MISNKIIRAYALKNAVEHEGKAVVGNVIPGLFNHGLTKNKIKETIPKINEILKEVNKLSLDNQKKEFEKLQDLIGHRPEQEGLPELPDTKKGIVMRFSPSPSGPLHIGHALTSSTSFLYTQKYNGKLIIRIEDTNPENIYKPAYEMIKKDSKWLFNNKCSFSIQSERMNLYYKYVDKLLKKESVYVCTCDSEKFREFAKNKRQCPCRNLDIKDNLKRWEKMLDKGKNGFKAGEAVLRFKSDMEHKNIAMRDFPLARINESNHPLQKNKYNVWPLMNLAVSVDDIDMKITHVIRAKEHRDNAEKQKLIFEVLNKKYPWCAFLGRIHFKDLELSTTKMRQEIESGKYTGWDDLKLPTLISIKKQGYKPEAFHRFAEQIGLNEIDKKMDKKEFFQLLDTFNKEN